VSGRKNATGTDGETAGGRERTVVEGHAADAAAGAAADTAAAAAPHLISRGPGDDDGRTMRTRGRAAPPLGSDGTVGG